MSSAFQDQLGFGAGVLVAQAIGGKTPVRFAVLQDCSIDFAPKIEAPREIKDVGAALDRVAHDLTSSGAVSAASNWRAFRVAEEPLDMFRRHMAVHARLAKAPPMLLRSLAVAAQFCAVLSIELTGPRRTWLRAQIIPSAK